MKTTLITVALLAALATAMPIMSHDDIAYAALERRASSGSVVVSRTVADSGVITKVKTQTEHEQNEDSNEETGDVSSDSNKKDTVITTVKDPNTGIRTQTHDTNHVITSSDSNTITGDFENDTDTTNSNEVTVKNGMNEQNLTLTRRC
jgi:hypothetical protein